MRKFIYVLSFMLATYFLYAQPCDRQCAISGPSSMEIGQSYTFTVNQTAQCSECYDWDVTGSVSIVGSDQNQSVTIQRTDSGPYTICVNYIDETGCHYCCISGGQCCIPYLDSYFICNGWDYGHGAIYIAYDELCDRNTVEYIEWDVNGAYFLNGPLAGQSSGITYGPGSPGNIGASPCPDNLNIFVTATVHFNNGCPPVTITQDIEPGMRISGEIKLKLFPNPATSFINVSLESQKSLQKVRIIGIDVLTGTEIFTQRLTGNDKVFTKRIEIPRAYHNKMLQVIVLDNGKITATKQVMIK